MANCKAYSCSKQDKHGNCTLKDPTTCKQYTGKKK